MLGERPRRYRRKRAAETDPVGRRIVVRRSSFDTQNQVLLSAQKDAPGVGRRAARIHRKLQQRAQTRQRENVYIAIQIIAVDSDKHVTRHSGESIKMIRHPRVAYVPR
jgi:hypothetical protein